MPELGKGQIVAWAVAAALLVLAAVRFAGGGSEADGPPIEVDGDGAAAHGSAAPGSGGGAGSASGAPGDVAPGSGGELYVHVAGAVRRPGLYRLPPGSRVATAVELAGGTTRRAELAGVNLAAPLQDGQQVVVPLRGRAGAAAAGAGAAVGAGAASTAAGAPGSQPVSLSTATVEQLDELDGIGPTLAQRIVEYRDAHGGFRSVDELREVDGIGEKRFAALRAAVTP